MGPHIYQCAGSEELPEMFVEMAMVIITIEGIMKIARRMC